MPETTDDSAMRRLWRRLGSSDEEIEAAELKETSRSAGANPIDSCNCGDVVTICGPLRSVTMKPVESGPTGEAEVYDGSGRVTATGRMNTVGGRRTIYNPRYSLRAVAVGE